MQKIRIIELLSENTLHLEDSIPAVTIYSKYLRQNISETPYLTLQKSHRCTVLDLITGTFKASYLCTILDKFIRNANPKRTIGEPDNLRTDKCSSTVIHTVYCWLSFFMVRDTALTLRQKVRIVRNKYMRIIPSIMSGG